MKKRTILSSPTGVRGARTVSPRPPPQSQERRRFTQPALAGEACPRRQGQALPAGEHASLARAAARSAANSAEVEGKPRAWIDAEYLISECKVSPEELDEARAAARKDLLFKKKPVPAGKQPHLLITIGAPGAGKSTVAAAVAKSRGSGDYVTIDVDLAVKYHPRYHGMWNALNVATGAPTGVGVTLGYWTCNAPLEDILTQLYEDILYSEGDRYNIILQSHSQINLVGAKLAGYQTTLLFVGAPLETVIRRSRHRAIETGKFLAATLSAQDEVVSSMWTMYRDTAAWYGLWADEFLVADNSRGSIDGRLAGQTVQKIPLHCAQQGGCGSWEDRLAVAQKAINLACGCKADNER